MARRTPVPLMAAALLLCLWVVTARSGSVPRFRCDEDYKELLTEIKNNRNLSIVEINRQLGEAVGDQRASLEAMREQTWDDEEGQRAQASQMWRDCIRAAKGKK